MTGSRGLREGSPRTILFEAIINYISGRHETNCNFTLADIPNITSIKGMQSLINSNFIVKVGRDAKRRCFVYRLADPLENEVKP